MSTAILGVSAYYHDSAACLVVDGRIVAAAQEERFTREKHSPAFPAKAAAWCLEHAGLTVGDLSAVSFYEKPFTKFERLLATYHAVAPAGFGSFLKAMPQWMKRKLWLRKVIADELGYDGLLLFPEHHYSHAASAFFPSPFEEAAVLTLDGVGEWSTATFGVGRDTTLALNSEIRFPHSLGLLYSAFTYFCGFKVNSGEYKLMGLAPYGRPIYADRIREHLIDIKDDGSFWMDQSCFTYLAGLRMTGRRFEQIFDGPRREPESLITQREMDLARSVQEVLEDVVLLQARHIRETTGMKNLCMAGGVSLNCVANGKLLRANIFDEIWIQPAAGDAGGALGSALAVWHGHFGGERLPAQRDRQQATLLGPAYTNDQISQDLETLGAVGTQLPDDQVFDHVAGLLEQGKVVGWFSGAMEFGPRALGGRSIIGDPRDQDMQTRMNLQIKFRESFRPFAPSVLAEHASEWFDLDAESPYMLLVAPVHPKRRLETTEADEGKFGIEKLKVPRSTIPAVTHVDGSARVQTVRREDNPRYHALLTAFHARTGCPLVVNTSFNVRGEPIVCTPVDAYRCFMRTDMDVLVLQDHVLLKPDQPPWEEEGDWRDTFQLD